MAKRLLPFILLFGLAFLPGGTASAHVLETDGDIGAVLHMNPDDNPTSGTPTNYVLAFDDTTNTLNLADCGCTVTIRQNGKALSTSPLTITGQLDSSNTFTFPKANIYTIEVTGTPNVAGAFQPFKLAYTVRVTSGNLQTQPVPVLLWVGMGGMIGLVMLAAYAMEVSYTSKKHKDSSGEA